MKKITLVLSLIASAFLVTSCASNTPAVSDQPTVTSDNSTVVSHHGKSRHHHDYKGEMK